MIPARNVLCAAALSLLSCAALADVGFLGTIVDIPYDPATAIVAASNSAPGAHELSGSITLPDVFLGTESPGGSAYGNLQSGVLQARALGYTGYNIATYASLTDRLWISGDSAPSIDFNLSAYIQGDANPYTYAAGASLNFWARDATTGKLLAHQYFVVRDSCWQFASGPEQTCQDAPEPGTYTLSGAFALPSSPGVPVDVTITFAASTFNGGMVDASHSAHLSLNLPAGVTVASDSGIFLADVTSAVPEPSSLALFASAGIFWAARRTRRKTVSAPA